jgi:glycerophosphoryl diester phosphodiesterase
VLIARHENELSGSTDVAAHPEFAALKTRKRIDGIEVEGWFAEDFTLAQIKTLRARQTLPALRGTDYDSRFEVPTFAEVIALAQAHGVGIYPETKHPTYFQHEGRRVDGAPIAFDISQALVAALVGARFTDARRVFIQSFEISNLLDLKHRILPAAGLDLPLVQLIGNTDPALAQPDDGFSQPYDIVWHARRGDDLGAIYGGLAQLPGGIDANTGWAALVEPAALRWMATSHASGIGPWTTNLLPRTRLAPPRVADGRRIGAQLSGAVHPMLAAAHAAGLQVHAYTVRAEDDYRVLDGAGKLVEAEAEIGQLFELGVDGVFTDHADIGARARATWRMSHQPVPAAPR